MLKEKEVLIHKLQETLSQVKQLSGFLPICAACKKIHDDEGYWNQIEAYIRDHSEVQFSHSICPDCARNYTRRWAFRKSRITDKRAGYGGETGHQYHRTRFIGRKGDRV